MTKMILYVREMYPGAVVRLGSHFTVIPVFRLFLWQSELYGHLPDVINLKRDDFQG